MAQFSSGVLSFLQIIQQNKQLNPLQQRQQLEQVAVMIQKIKQQILQQQQMIQAQQSLGKQQPTPQPTSLGPNPATSQPSSASTASGGDPKDLESLSSLSLNPQQVPQSRLRDWIKDSNNQAVAGGVGMAGVDPSSRAPGSNKPLQQSHSTPNLLVKENVSTGMQFSDGTWSGVGSSPAITTTSWPTSVPAASTTTDATNNPTTTSTATTSSGSTGGVDNKTTTSSVSTPTSDTGSNAGSDSGLPGEGEPSSSSLDIQEFVPGKPWAGFTNKNVEDDPNITPGSVNRSLSLSMVKENEIAAILGGKSSTSNSPTSDAGWSQIQQQQQQQKWSTDSSDMANWSAFSKSGRQPPGIPTKSFNRSFSQPASMQNYMQQQSMLKIYNKSLKVNRIYMLYLK